MRQRWWNPDLDDIDLNDPEVLAESTQLVISIAIAVSISQSLMFLVMAALLHDVRFATAAVMAPIFLWLPLFTWGETVAYVRQRRADEFDELADEVVGAARKPAQLVTPYARCVIDHCHHVSYVRNDDDLRASGWSRLDTGDAICDQCSGQVVQVIGGESPFVVCSMCRRREEFVAGDDNTEESFYSPLTARGWKYSADKTRWLCFSCFEFES
jgi:hypothetical protein